MTHTHDERRAVPLWQLRNHRRATQVQMAVALGTTQSGVSRIERQADLFVSTLARYVAATGGTLRLVADYPDESCEVRL